MKWSQALCTSILVDGLSTQTDGRRLGVDLDGGEIVARKPSHPKPRPDLSASGAMQFCSRPERGRLWLLPWHVPPVGLMWRRDEALDMTEPDVPARSYTKKMR